MAGSNLLTFTASQADYKSLMLCNVTENVVGCGRIGYNRLLQIMSPCGFTWYANDVQWPATGRQNRFLNVEVQRRKLVLNCTNYTSVPP